MSPVLLLAAIALATAPPAESGVSALADRLSRAISARFEALEGMLDDADLYAKHQACLMLQESGSLDRRVEQLAVPGTLRDAALAIVKRFVDAGQVGRLRELAGSHSVPEIREALRPLLPPAPPWVAETA